MNFSSVTCYWRHLYRRSPVSSIFAHSAPQLWAPALRCRARWRMLCWHTVVKPSVCSRTYLRPQLSDATMVAKLQFWPVKHEHRQRIVSKLIFSLWISVTAWVNMWVCGLEEQSKNDATRTFHIWLGIVQECVYLTNQCTKCSYLRSNSWIPK